MRLGCTNISNTGEALFLNLLLMGGTKPYNLVRDYQFNVGDTIFVSGAFQYRGMQKAQDGRMYPNLSILVQSINAISTKPLVEEDTAYTPTIMDNQEIKINNKRQEEITEDYDIWGKKQ